MSAIRVDFHDDYEHPSEHIDYILENELMEGPQSHSSDNGSYNDLRTLFNSTLLASCKCNSNSIECTTESCSHGRNYIISSNELVLNPNRHVHDLIYECSSLCHCLLDCGNRLVQFGPRQHLQIIASNRLGDNQSGLVSKRPIGIGAFVCEYAGEVLTEAEAQRRHGRSANGAMNYVLCLIERSSGPDGSVHRTYVDPTNRGNIGRYLNHSCDPNCEVISVRVNGPVPRLGIFTKRPIAEYDELTFDYAGGASDEMFEPQMDSITMPCLCGAAKCRGFLPNLNYE